MFSSEDVLMDKLHVKRLIERICPDVGLSETCMPGVQVFRIIDSVRCAPVVYEPSIIVIINGSKEAILDGRKYVYDNQRYMCCPTSMPVEAGTPNASPAEPLIGVYISLDTQIMKELAREMDAAGDDAAIAMAPMPQSLSLARWDDRFTVALSRLLDLCDTPEEASVLGAGRLRELYYAVFKGEAGAAARRAFGIGNEITQAIEYLSSRLDQPVTIEDAAAAVGMSRAAFHRKFKQATTLSPIQYVKAMRLNNAAMQIASGTHVNVAARDVGYVSSSQFSREFKRMYGQSPSKWVRATEGAMPLA